MTEMAEKFAELQKNYGIKPEEFTNALAKLVPSAPAMPKVLEMAQGNVWNDYHAKFSGWEQTVKRDEETGEAVTTVTLPEVPSADDVIETAQKFYNFVNGK